MHLRSPILSNILIAVVGCIGLANAARADCNIPFVPPVQSPFFCTSSTPQQAEDCRQQAQQAYAQQVASSRQEWQRRQFECQAREQQQDAQRQAAAQAATEKADAARRAADQQRYLAEQKAKQAEAELEQQRAQAETAKQEAATAKSLAAAAEAKRQLAVATGDRAAWDSPITGGRATVLGVLAFLVFATFKEWVHASVPRKFKILAFVAPAVVELSIYLIFGVDIHEPTVADFVKLNLPIGVAAGTGFVVHHTIRYAYS